MSARTFVAWSCLLLAAAGAHAFNPTSVFFDVPVNVPCQESATTRFTARVTHTGTLMQSDVDSGQIGVTVVDADIFSDDSLSTDTHNLPPGMSAGDAHTFTTTHRLWCTPKSACELRGAFGGSGESEGELRVEYGDDSDNHGCATVLCSCGEAVSGLELIADLSTAPGRVELALGGQLSFALRLRVGERPPDGGSFLRITFYERSTRTEVPLDTVDDFQLPRMRAQSVGTMCTDVSMPESLGPGTYVLVSELIDVTGRVLEEDFVEVELVPPAAAAEAASPPDG